MMRLERYDDERAMYAAAARVLLERLTEDPTIGVGFATGDTQIPLYRELVQRGGPAAFSQLRSFNLDEYVGLSPDHAQSYHTYMHHHFFNHVAMDPARCHIPRGDAKDLWAECRLYDRLLCRHPRSVQYLGIGSNGHIGFNEPSSALLMRTHVVRLSDATRAANRQHFRGIDEVPRSAVTMGLEGIFAARTIVLLVTGRQKAAALRQCVAGRVSTSVPASLLHLHRDVRIFADRGATHLLEGGASSDEICSMPPLKK